VFSRRLSSTPRPASATTNSKALADGTHETSCQSPPKSRYNSRILGVLGPLVPDQALGSITIRIKSRKREHSDPVASAGATNRPLPNGPGDLVEHGRRDLNRTVGGGPSSCSHRQFDQRSYLTRSTEQDGTHRRQPSGNCLPKQVIGCIEARYELKPRAITQVPLPDGHLWTRSDRLLDLSRIRPKPLLPIACFLMSFSITEAKRHVAEEAKTIELDLFGEGHLLAPAKMYRFVGASADLKEVQSLGVPKQENCY
jgi:hypothetical protein